VLTGGSTKALPDFMFGVSVITYRDNTEDHDQATPPQMFQRAQTFGFLVVFRTNLGICHLQRLNERLEAADR
jgi:hypothetical protein